MHRDAGIWLTWLIGLACLGTASLAHACVYPPPPPPREGESGAEYGARTEGYLESYIRASQKKGEVRSFNEATSIFFARLVESKEIQTGGSPYGRRAVFMPITSIKGELPKRKVTLQTKGLNSCGYYGGGYGVWSNVGELIVIFDDPTYGLSSVGARYVQDERLVLAVNAFIDDNRIYERDRPKLVGPEIDEPPTK